MARFCTNCGTALPENANNCPRCGKPQGVGGGAAAQPVAAAASTGGLADNVAGLLAYVTIIPAIIFLVLEPFNKNRFVRFHSFQSIFFGVAWIAVCIVLSILGMMPFVHILTALLIPLVCLAFFVIWVLLLIKAYSGQMFKLPVIGDIAETQANVV